MPFDSIGILAAGTLPNAEAVLYAPNAGTSEMASVNVRLAAVDAAAAYGVTLLIRNAGSGTSTRLTGFSYALATGGHDIYPPDGSLKLGPGDELRGYASVAAKVAYVIEGGKTTRTP